jgi:hypothetical protein
LPRTIDPPLEGVVTVVLEAFVTVKHSPVLASEDPV